MTGLFMAGTVILACAPQYLNYRTSAYANKPLNCTLNFKPLNDYNLSYFHNLSELATLKMHWRMQWRMVFNVSLLLYSPQSTGGSTMQLLTVCIKHNVHVRI